MLIFGAVSVGEILVVVFANVFVKGAAGTTPVVVVTHGQDEVQLDWMDRWMDGWLDG